MDNQSNIWNLPVSIQEAQWAVPSLPLTGNPLTALTLPPTSLLLCIQLLLTVIPLHQQDLSSQV